MTYGLEASAEADKKFQKLAKRNIKRMEIVNKKVQQILENPYRFKPLMGDMKGSRRVHIDRSFVLIYDIDERRKTVRLLDYGHHDDVY